MTNIIDLFRNYQFEQGDEKEQLRVPLKKFMDEALKLTEEIGEEYFYHSFVNSSKKDSEDSRFDLIIFYEKSTGTWNYKCNNKKVGVFCKSDNFDHALDELNKFIKCYHIRIKNIFCINLKDSTFELTIEIIDAEEADIKVLRKTKVFVTNLEKLGYNIDPNTIMNYLIWQNKSTFKLNIN